MRTTLLLDSPFALPKAEEADNAPKWAQLFPIGVRYRADFPGGRIDFSREYLAEMKRNWEEAGRPPRAVNYFHRGLSVPGDTTPIDAKVAAGWIEDLELREDGLYGLIRWTDRARAYIRADELRYLSPEFRPGRIDKATGKLVGPTLVGAALLNDPFFDTQPRVAASDNHAADDAAGETQMLKKLIGILALASTAAEDDVVSAVEGLKAKLNETTKKLHDAEAQVKKLSEGNGDVLKLSETVTSLSETLKATNAELKAAKDEVAKLKKAAFDSEVQALCDDLVSKGIVTPKQTEQLKKLAETTGIDAVKSLFDGAEPRVDLKERGIERGAEAGKEVAAAQKRLDERVAELRKHNLSFAEAHTTALSEMPDVAEVLYGDVPSTTQAANR